jgi:Glycosyltransferase 61
VSPLREFVRAARRRAMVDTSRLSESISAVGREAASINSLVVALRAEIEAAQERRRDLLAVTAADLVDRADVAALPHAKLRSERLVLEGSAAQRFNVRRRVIGDPVERPFRRWLGITRSATEDPEIQALWDRLLAFEAGCGDRLRGDPSSVLDVPGGTVQRHEKSGLWIRLDDRSGKTLQHVTASESVIAIPKFTYEFTAVKLQNFGHWLVDCLPQVVPLADIAPQARFLVPGPIKAFQRSLLALIGVQAAQLVPWDDAPLEADRWLILENDGSIGGGRPLSSVVEMRRRLAPAAGYDSVRRTRRVYVSRRDAGPKGDWITNEPEVEAVFRSRGFEVLVMSDCPLEDQVRLFREAAVVAGLSGAGLTDIVFSSPGIHVIVILSDRLIRWYATTGRARAKWATRLPDARESLAAVGDSPRFYTHLAATCEQMCHSFLSPDRTPLDELARFVDEVLAQAG